MNASAQVSGAIGAAAAVEAARGEFWHRVRLTICSLLCGAGLVAIGAYGCSYYLLGPYERPFSALHRALRPSGSIGVKLGIAGVAMFVIIFLYPLRKRISWMARRGNSQHWLDFHIVLGLTAPVLIAFHASFKFHGIAGMAFWLMLAVAISGIVGRYLYAQVPRSINSAELSLRELIAQEEQLTAELAEQKRIPSELVESVLHVPEPDEVKRMPLLVALLDMIWLDISRPWRIARLRRSALHGTQTLLSLDGLLQSSDRELESVIVVARSKASMAKRIVFLGRAQQTLHLWHVIHRPFSYSFLVLAVVHIGVALGLGFI